MKVAAPSLLAALVFFLATSGQVPAQSNIDSRVQKLEETIQALERRVASLEAQLRERSAPAGAPPGKEGWRKLQSGMTESEVERLLGSPSKVDANPVVVHWQYERGYVEFDARSHTVRGWSEP